MYIYYACKMEEKENAQVKKTKKKGEKKKQINIEKINIFIIII